MSALRLALPSKGRLAEPALRLFRDAGIAIEPDSRRLRLVLPEHDLDVLLARAEDIPVWVEDRAVDCGIAGSNQIEEAGVAVDVRLDLGFGRCRLALAVPATGAARKPADLAGTRVATSYPRTVRAWLDTQGIAATCIPISSSTPPRPSPTSSRAARRCVRTGSARSRRCARPRPCCWPPPGSTRAARSASRRS